MAAMTSKTDSLPSFHSIKEVARRCRVCERTGTALDPGK